MLWVANRTFGITWVCTQLRVTKQVKVSGYAFKKTDENEEPEESEEEYEETEKINSLQIDSGSEEEVEVDEEEED